MIKFRDILESYFEKEDEYGFKDSSLDKIKITFEYLCSVDDIALVKDKKTNEYFIVYFDNIDDDYQQGWYSYEQDYDEDGPYTSTTFSDDTEITPDSISLYTQHMVMQNDYETNTNNFLNGTSPMSVLKITPENKKDVYQDYIELFKCYFDEPRKK